MKFISESNPSRVIFGRGSRDKIAEELDRLGISNAIVLSTPGLATPAAEIARDIQGRAGLVYPGAARHTPVEVTEAAMNALQSVKADGILSVGENFSIALGKALALRTQLPQVVIPTTFGGSEMTTLLEQTERGETTALRSLSVLPETVLYDPALIASLHSSMSGPSGMMAMAHAVEALYSEEANPIVSLMAEESLRALGQALPQIMSGSAPDAAWDDAVYGAWLAGACFGSVMMSLHHKLCHILSGAFVLEPASIHCLMLPYSAVYNRDAAPEAMQRTARSLQAAEAPSALYDLMLQAETHHSLRDLGLTKDDLEHVAELAVKDAYYNPRPVTRESILEMLSAAYEGTRP